MDWIKCIKSFVVIAEKKGFSAASKDIFISTATLSKQMAWLESQLGALLFNRSTRRIELTTEGHVFFQHAKQLLNNLENAIQSIAESNDRPKGVLRVAISQAFGETYVLPSVPQFLEKYPEIRLDLIFKKTPDVVLDESLDLVIRVGLPNLSKNMLSYQITETSRGVYGSQKYFETNKKPKKPADLSKYNCLIHPGFSKHDAWEFKNNEVIKISGNLRANNCHALLSCAIAGLGLIWISGFWAEPSVKNGRLIEVLQSHKCDSFPAFAITHRRYTALPKIKCFIDYLRESYNWK